MSRRYSRRTTIIVAVAIPIVGGAMAAGGATAQDDRPQPLAHCRSAEDNIVAGRFTFVGEPQSAELPTQQDVKAVLEEAARSKAISAEMTKLEWRVSEQVRTKDGPVTVLAPSGSKLFLQFLGNADAGAWRLVGFNLCEEEVFGSTSKLEPVS